jgi:hypothetical protein
VRQALPPKIVSRSLLSLRSDARANDSCIYFRIFGFWAQL